MSCFIRTALILLLVALLAACNSNPSRKEVNDQKAAELHVKLGTGYMRQGRYEVALEKLKKALEYDPKSSTAHTVIAVLYGQIGETEKSGFHYREAVKVNPEDGGAQNNLGAYLCDQGQYAEAEQHFLKAIDNPFYKTPEAALTNAGHCARDEGNLEKAETYFRKVLGYNEQSRDALFALASIFEQRSDHFRARAFIQRYHASYQPGPDTLFLAYQIESALGNKDDAEEFANKLNSQFPNSDEAKKLGRGNSQ